MITAPWCGSETSGYRDTNGLYNDVSGLGSRLSRFGSGVRRGAKLRGLGLAWEEEYLTAWAMTAASEGPLVCAGLALSAGFLHQWVLLACVCITLMNGLYVLLSWCFPLFHRFYFPLCGWMGCESLFPLLSLCLVLVSILKHCYLLFWFRI